MYLALITNKAPSAKLEVLYPEGNSKYVAPSLIDRVKILIENLVHGKHMNTIRLEDGAQSVVATNLAFVVRVLEVMFFDVLPDPLDRLRTRELSFAEKSRQ